MHKGLSDRAKRMLAMAVIDALMKFGGVAMFLVGLGGLGEVPTDPKMIVRALGLFFGGISLVAWNSYLIDNRKGDKK